MNASEPHASAQDGASGGGRAARAASSSLRRARGAAAPRPRGQRRRRTRRESPCHTASVARRREERLGTARTRRAGSAATTLSSLPLRRARAGSRAESSHTRRPPRASRLSHGQRRRGWRTAPRSAATSCWRGPAPTASASARPRRRVESKLDASRAGSDEAICRSPRSISDDRLAHGLPRAGRPARGAAAGGDRAAGVGNRAAGDSAALCRRPRRHLPDDGHHCRQTGQVC